MRVSPRPRKLSVASDTIASPSSTDAMTMMGAKLLGRMCSIVMRRSPAPIARAASTNMLSRRLMTVERTTRATTGTLTMESEAITFATEGPSTAMNDSARNSAGMARMMSMKRCSVLSTQPPR